MLALHYFFTVTLRERFEDKERGATAVEYGLLVGLISVAIVGTLLLLGPKLDGLFQTVLNSLP